MTPLKLLQSDKPRAVLEGIERLTSAGDGHAFDQLLNGIRYQAPTAQDFLLAFAGRLLPNEHFKPADDSSRQLIACHELAVLGLVCKAPESSILGNAFKQVVTSLALGPFGFAANHLAISLSPIPNAHERSVLNFDSRSLALTSTTSADRPTESCPGAR